jgi:hypothetical protein
VLPLRALPLVALAALPADLCGEDRVAILERQKQEFLAATVEKKEFWTQVERKGAAAKRLRELDEELGTLQQELAGLDPGSAQAETAIAQAAEVNRRAEEILAELQGRKREVAARNAELEQLLARWGASRAEAAR